MKKIILVIAVLSVIKFSANAQTDTGKTVAKNNKSEMRTIFKNPDGPVKVGFFVGPEFAYTQFKTKPVYMAGLSAGLILNHNFSVGFCGYGIMNSQNLSYANIKDTTTGYLYGGYGGLRLEFILNPNAPIHLSFPLLIGGGGLSYSDVNYADNYNHSNNMNQNDNSIDMDAFFVLQPGVMVSFNLLKYLRFDTGISYRYTPDLNLINTSPSLINNFNAIASLKFGKF